MLRRLLAALLLALPAALLVPAGPAMSAPVPGTGAAAGTHSPRPVVFVHGYSGSGSQFETPARRFTSNGYAPGQIEAEEYDSTFATTTVAAVHASLDRRIARLLARWGGTQVDLVGHSLGTAVAQSYLTSSPARAASVAHYVNLDGAGAAALPGGVATLAIWGQLNPTGTITGAWNVDLTGQGHTEVVTSAESFREMYRFLTGREPRSTKIRAQLPGTVELSGRAVLFPSNAGIAGARLDVYRVDPRTGQRINRFGTRLARWFGVRPVASYQLSQDGSWGPFRAIGTAHYEFAIVRDGVTRHFYRQPFVRSDNLIRLLDSTPGQGLDALVEKSASSTALAITRNKEWWSDQGSRNDTLTVNGVSAITGVTPRSKLAIAVFAYDAKLDGVSAPGVPVPALSGLPFLTGVDLAIPAASPPTGVIRIVSRQRGSGSDDVINVPNWASATDRVSVQFNDYTRHERH